MKLKTIVNYLLFAVLAVQLVSCDNKETLIPNATPTGDWTQNKRTKRPIRVEFGWKAIYFTDTTQLGGFTHVFKFKNGSVDMASDYDNDTSVNTSEYSIN
jgi:hypothetical protein